MNSSTIAPVNITKISQGISIEVNLWDGFSINNKWFLEFSPTAKSEVQKAMEAIFIRLSQIKDDLTASEITTIISGNVWIITSNVPPKGIITLREKLKKWRRKNQQKHDDSVQPNIKVSHNPFCEVYLSYTDNEGKKQIFPCDFTLKFSEKDLDFDTKWKIFYSVLQSKWNTKKIFDERKRKEKGK